MSLARNRYISYMFRINIVFLTVLIITYYYAKNILPTFYVYALFLVESLDVAFCIILSRGKLRFSKNDKFLFGIVFCTQLIASLISTIRFDVTVFDIHKILLYVLMIYICLVGSRHQSINEQEFEKIISATIFIGILAVIFNFLNNAQYFAMHDLSLIMHYTWHFSSFYFTRATYGIFLCICAIASLYRAEKRKSKFYIILYIVFVLNVLITAARMEMIAVVAASLVYLMYSKRYKKLVIGISVTLGVMLLFFGLSYADTLINTLLTKYSLFFTHSQGGATDFSTGRVELWTKALEYSDPFSFFFGHGVGSKDTIMLKEKIQILGEDLTSFHSAYVDCYFEMGILGLFIMLKPIVDTLQSAKKNIEPRMKNFIYSIICVFMIVNIADGNMSPFTTDMFSPVAAFFVYLLLRCILNSEDFRRNKC